MIFQEIEFIRPQSIAEAVSVYRECSEAGLKPEYFAGGTELVTMARDGKLSAGAFVDLKTIPDTHRLESEDGELTIGTSVRLNDLSQRLDTPLMTRCIDNLADHTVRNSITLGGNIAGRLPYREAMLPLVLAGADAFVAGSADTASADTRRVPLRELFDKRLRLASGEFVVAFALPREAAESPFWYGRWVRSTRVDYPIVTLACTASEDSLLFATSGSFAYPVWGSIFFDELKENQAERVVHGVLDGLGSFRTDFRASAEYRRALMALGLNKALGSLWKKSG
ncbi:MAG: FAD binding domain-containing protein [Spirochaetaceae bacterium]